MSILFQHLQWRVDSEQSHNIAAVCADANTTFTTAFEMLGVSFRSSRRYAYQSPSRTRRERRPWAAARAATPVRRRGIERQAGVGNAAVASTISEMIAAFKWGALASDFEIPAARHKGAPYCHRPLNSLILSTAAQSKAAIEWLGTSCRFSSVQWQVKAFTIIISRSGWPLSGILRRHCTLGNPSSVSRPLLNKPGCG